MTLVRITLGLIVTLFIAAEVARPTHIPAKTFSGHALVLHSQAVAGRGVSGSLDPNLLADLPRIHPDAAGNVNCFEHRDGSLRLFGTFDGDDGSAVFVISDDVRLGAEATSFGNATQPHGFFIDIPHKGLGPGKHRLHVALVSRDQQGFFLMPRAIAVTAGGASIESSDCRMRRRPLAIGVAGARHAKQ